MAGSASKTVRNQYKTGQSIITAAEVHKKTITTALYERQKAPDDKKLSQADFERNIQWLADEMGASNDFLWNAELAYTSEQSDDAAAADERDEAGAVLDDALRTSRNSAIQLGSRRSLNALGMAAPPPNDLSGLATYAENVVKMHRENPTPLTKAALTYTPAAVADHIEALLGDYKVALKSDQLEKRELEDAKGLRDQAQLDWKVTYQSVANQLEGLFRQAGRPDLADRVRPTIRQTRGEEPAEDVVDIDATDNIDTPQPQPAVDEA